MDFSASNTALWSAMLQMGLIACIMLLAHLLRRKVLFFRNSLMPTAVLAGFFALLVRISGIIPINTDFMEMITYHTIALGFIALSLRIPQKSKGTEKGDFIAAKSGAVIISTYLIQGILGLTISISLAYTIMPDFFKAAGILLPMGYGQGPGQANNVGSTYEVLGFKGGQSFGLSIAAVGALCACIVGVIYLNYLRHTKKITLQTREEISGSVTIDDFQDKNEVPISESVDRLSVQMALVLIVYAATYFVSKGLTGGLSAIAPGLADAVNPIIWGFNFIVGSLLATLLRKCFDGLTKAKLMTRQYPNNYLLSRISGLAFDLMIICGIVSIDIKDLSGMWLPFVLMCVLGGYVTLVYLQWLCKKIYPSYYYEALLSMYGMLTGTIGSGVLLLREIDPLFKTPAADNLLTGSSFAIAFGAPMLIFIGMAPKSTTMLFVTFGLLFVYMAILLLFMFKLQRKHK